jgi:membrane-bound serine protease (ClpP class)
MALILQTLADPTLAYALFIVGCCAVMTELFHPGAFIPGVSGGICLLLAFVAFLLLPVNWASLALIVAALALFTLDVHLTAHGGLTVVGLAAFAAGSLTLYGPPGSHAPLAVPLPLIVGLTLVGAGLSTFVVRAALHTRHLPTVNGPQRLLGRTGTVTTTLAPTGTVQVAGELWSARLCPPRPIRTVLAEPAALDVTTSGRHDAVLTAPPTVVLAPGQPVRIVGRRGLILEVEPVASTGGGAVRTA